MSVGSSPARWMGRSDHGRLDRGFGFGGEDFEVELFVEGVAFLTEGGLEEVVAQVDQKAEVAGGVLAQGLQQRRGQELGITGGAQRCWRQAKDCWGGSAPVRKRLRMRLARGKRSSDSAGCPGGSRRPATVRMERESGRRWPADATRRRRPGPSPGLRRPGAGAAGGRHPDVAEPFFAEDLGAGPAVVGREGDAEGWPSSR